MDTAAVAIAMTAGVVGLFAGTARAATPSGTVASTWHATSTKSVRASADQPAGSLQLTVRATHAMKATSTEQLDLTLSGGQFVGGKITVVTAPRSNAATVSGTISPTRATDIKVSSTSTDVDLKETEKIDISTVLIDATGLAVGTIITARIGVITGETGTGIGVPTGNAAKVEIATVQSNGKVTAANVTALTSWGSNESAGNLTVSLTNNTGALLSTTVLTITLQAVTDTAPTRSVVWSRTPRVTATSATARSAIPSANVLTLHVTEASGRTAAVTLTTVRYKTTTAWGRITISPTWKTAKGAEVGAVTPGTNADVPDSGYWEVAANGAVFPFGSAKFHGAIAAKQLSSRVVGMAEDKATGGYWLATSDGAVFSFDAPFHGSMAGKHLAAPVVGISAMPTGGGYWLVASDGEIFTFGNAGFYGSAFGNHLDSPVTGMSVTSDGGGYTLAARTGTSFNFGNAEYHASCHDVTERLQWIGIVGTVLVASDGSIASAGGRGGCDVLHKSYSDVVGATDTPSRLSTSGPLGAGFYNGSLWLVAASGRIFGPTTVFPSYGTTARKHLDSAIVGIAWSYGG